MIIILCTYHGWDNIVIIRGSFKLHVTTRMSMKYLIFFKKKIGTNVVELYVYVLSNVTFSLFLSFKVFHGKFNRNIKFNKPYKIQFLSVIFVMNCTIDTLIRLINCDTLSTPKRRQTLKFQI